MSAKNRGGYTLRGGVIINKSGKLYGNHNLTAKVAEWWIAQDLNNRKMFSELAKEYDEYEKPIAKVQQ